MRSGRRVNDLSPLFPVEPVPEGRGALGELVREALARELGDRDSPCAFVTLRQLARRMRRELGVRNAFSILHAARRELQALEEVVDGRGRRWVRRASWNPVVSAKPRREGGRLRRRYMFAFDLAARRSA